MVIFIRDKASPAKVDTGFASGLALKQASPAKVDTGFASGLALKQASPAKVDTGFASGLAPANKQVQQKWTPVLRPDLR